MIWRAVTTHLSRHGVYTTTPLPVSIQLSFLRRTTLGAAELTVQDVKRGGRTSTVHVTLEQTSDKKNGQEDGKEAKEVKAMGYITVSPPSAEVGLTAPTDWTLHPPRTPVNLAALAVHGHDGPWRRFQDRYSAFRVAGQNIEVFAPEQEEQEQGRLIRHKEQWVRFRPGGQPARWTNEALLFLVDMFPTALDGLARVATATTAAAAAAPFWFPTVALTVDVKKQLPAQGVEWLYSQIHNKTMRGGRSDIQVVVLDAQGELVAVASQVSLVMSASRNIGQRL